MFEDICKNTPLDGSIAARNIDELEKHHMEATRSFLDDYEKGKTEGRYIDHELPFKIPFPDDSFDLGLSSHFLMLYPGLGINFHLPGAGRNAPYLSGNPRVSDRGQNRKTMRTDRQADRSLL